MSQLTFSDVATLWKADKRQWVKPASYAVYLQLCNHSLLPVFGDKKALDEALIQSQVNLLLSHGYSIKTVKDTMLVLRMILRYGEKLKVWSHLEFCVHYPTQADGSSPAQTLSIQQQRLLLKHLQGHLSFRNLGLRICLETGLRIGEIYGPSRRLWIRPIISCRMPRAPSRRRPTGTISTSCFRASASLMSVSKPSVTALRPDASRANATIRPCQPSLGTLRSRRPWTFTSIPTSRKRKRPSKG